MPLPILPDAETLAVQALAAQSAVTAITPRIGTVIPGSPTFPLIRLAKVAELFTDEEGVEDAQVQVECWADSDATASLLARTVVACRKDMAGTYPAGWVALVGVASGPIPAPDPESQRHRYLVTLDLSVGAN
jgi:hypothetical protein